MDRSLLVFLILIALLLALFFAFLLDIFPAYFVISPSVIILISIFIIAGIIGFILKYFDDNKKQK